jgi:Zn-dependent protease
MEVIVLIPFLFFSIILHEFAHGYVAYRMGDQTAYLSGRLTLNPLKHIDLLGTVFVPALCYLMGVPLFGWAKPVPVNPFHFSSPRRDMGKVAVAGPAVNLLLAFICAGLIKLLLIFKGNFSEQTLLHFFYFLKYGLFVNIFLAVFNLIPIPPLDGGRIVSAFLPLQASLKYERLFGRYGMWIVFGLILTGAVKYILFPPTQLILVFISKVFGL